jgi:endonuclease/exonuclease/phosphatase family metal-dependent hydrolase
MPRSVNLGHVAWVAIALLTGCRTGRSYPDAATPRYTGGRPAALAAAPARGDTLRIVSFNVAFAVEIDSAIALLRGEPALRDPDVLLLQEMDDAGTRRIADAMGMAYVYYPALFHLRTKRDFGNAVLSRWPITADVKLILPHRSWYARTHRIATVATIQVGATSIRVYSTHLGTLADVGPGSRRDQLRAILADAASHRHAIVGGDMNSGSVGRVARDAGFAWITEKGPSTTRLGRWDHLFLKGLAVAGDGATGTVLDVRGSSDHRPIWALVKTP